MNVYQLTKRFVLFQLVHTSNSWLSPIAASTLQSVLQVSHLPSACRSLREGDDELVTYNEIKACLLDQKKKIPGGVGPVVKKNKAGMLVSMEHGHVVKTAGAGGGDGGESRSRKDESAEARIPPPMSKTAKAKLTKAVDVAAEAALHLLATGSSAAAAAAAAATAAALANPVGGVVIGRPQPPPAVDTGELVVLSHVLSPKVAQEWKNLHSKVG